MLITPVYDVTKYAQDHPGGTDVMVEIAGADASEGFDSAAHSEDALEIMEAFQIGKLKTEGKTLVPKHVRLVAPSDTPARKDDSGGRSLALVSMVPCLALLAAYFGYIWIKAYPSADASKIHLTKADLSDAAAERKGYGFTEGVLLTAVAFAVAAGIFAFRLSVVLNFGTKPGQYPAHLKLPAMPQPDRLNQRGWLDPKTFQTLPLVKKERLSPNAYRFALALPRPEVVAGLPIGQHISLRGLVDGKFVSRPYTPVSNNLDRGVIELVLRFYDNGVLTNGYLRKLQVGDSVELRGPKGGIRYQCGMCAKAGMVAGGTGITPMYQVIRAICEDRRDRTEVSLIYANRTEQDILLKDELDTFARKYPRSLKVFYVIDEAPPSWQGGRGFVSKETLQERLEPSGPDGKVFLCGPPLMVQSVKTALGDLGYKLPGALSKPTDEVICF